MKRFIIKIVSACSVMFACIYLNSCSHIPLKEGGLEIDKDTTAGVDDIGVGRVTRQF